MCAASRLDSECTQRMKLTHYARRHLQGRVVGRLLGLPAPGAPLGALMSFNELEQHQHRGRPVTMAFYHLQRHDLALGLVDGFARETGRIVL